MTDRYEEMKDSPLGRYLVEAYELSCKKNKDYAQPDNQFANLEQAHRIGVPNSKGVAVRLQDKWIRFENGVSRNGEYAVKDESLHDTCLDIINYTAIYLAVREREGRGPKAPVD